MSGVLHALTMTSSTGAADPLLASNVLLLKTIGTNNATNASFVDSSSNNFTVTRTGDVTQGAFSPYVPTGYWSNYFDGSGDYLTAPAHAARNVGTSGDFTVEGWYNFNSFALSTYYQVLWQSTNYNGIKLVVSPSGTLIFFNPNNSAAITASSAIPLGSWVHVAVVRSSGTATMYINGVSVGSVANTAATSSMAGTIYVGVNGDLAGGFLNGHVSNFRMTTTAVYTANFTPPTTPLTAISGTSLLTCQDNRFIDRSSNNFTLTRTGDVSVRRFAPFGLSWDGSLGGSAYFDGNGDYLAVPSSSGQLGAGNFTVEMWAFPVTKTVSFPCLFSNYSSFSTGSFGIFADHNSSAGWTLAVNGTFPLINGGAVIYNQWTHLAVTRVGSTMTLYVNGVASGTATMSATLNGSGTSTYIGTAGDIIPQSFNGFISDVRIVGSAVYTANFTPPTSPVTAITNTSLLLNFNNAAAYDATRSSNLSLVGDAKTSTAQVKYATSSVIVDGTGDYVYPATGIEGLATGDFTIEGWIYPTNLTGPRVVYDGRPFGVHGAYPTLYINGTLRYYTNNADRIVGSSVSLNTWTHVAVCRSGSTTRLFQNGTEVGSFSDSVNYLAAAQRPFIGQNGFSDDSHFVGHLEDFRVSRTARYTSAFTPPARALPVTAG